MQVLDQPTIRKFYHALVARDASYLGTFLVGVKTTGIFCLPTCRARKPKLENVEFFTEVKDVLQHGYRPCKICRPTKHAHQPPATVEQAVALLHQQDNLRLTDADLRRAGLPPEPIRRWFKQHYGLTFQAYQRMLRVNNAYQALQKGQSVTRAAYDAGYESLSGFGYTFQRLLGKKPSRAQQQAIILLARFTTPLGPMYACASEQGVCLLEFTDRRMLETEFGDLQQRLQATIMVGENDHLRQLQRELTEYFAGTRQTFSVALDTPGTPFQQSVWQELLSIPYGATRTYQEQAQHLGRPGAVRAVASANGHNRVAIVIPCHRVIGKDGSLTGYGGGLERKAWLLQHEQQHTLAVQ
jgi:AraC family transcriptional regulator of adaptative response/methylated-DNA-[protein]-cysteine methyltransferase